MVTLKQHCFFYPVETEANEDEDALTIGYRK